MPGEGVVIDHPPRPGGLPGAHDPGRLEELPVGERVAMPLEVCGQVVGASLIRDPTMNENPASSSALRLAAESIPASATTTMSDTSWRSWNPRRTGSRVVVSALLPSEQHTSSGNPDGSTSSPTWICGSTRRSLLIPTRRSVSSFSASKCSVVTS